MINSISTRLHGIMQNTFVKRLIAGILIMIVSTGASKLKAAEHFHYRHHHRLGQIKEVQIAQQNSIYNGIVSGQLTRKEAIRLQMQQARIETDKRMALEDGHFSRFEKRRIMREQKQAGKRIFVLKHNDRRRHGFHRNEHHE